MSDIEIRVDIACNNPDNGLFWGRVAQIALPDQLLELTAKQWRITTPRGCPTMSEITNAAGRLVAIKLAGKHWPVTRSREWYGNWCWNAYWMTDQTARQFFVWLHGRRLFNCETGETRLFNCWKAPDQLPLEPEKRDPAGLGRLLVKAMLAERRPPASGSASRG
jgi:hypothetical protein